MPVGEDQVAHVEITREVARRFNHIYGREPDFEAKVEEAIKSSAAATARVTRSCARQYQEKGDQEALEKARALLEGNARLTLADRERLLGFLEGSGRSILVEPDALLTATPKVPGLDGRKMSKSYGNTIGLREDPDAVAKKLKTMQTDPARVRRTDPGDPDKCPVWDLHKIYSDEETQAWVQTGLPHGGHRLPRLQEAASSTSSWRRSRAIRAARAGVRGESRPRARHHRGGLREGARRGARRRSTKCIRRWAWTTGERQASPNSSWSRTPARSWTREALATELPPQQAEMPFAVVEGEPVTELPRDLYIPPDALQVFLEAFEGPLDLLLYLIRRQNLDILDIPIAEITRQYMQYIELMQELQLELAGEYLLMAAMLAEIKSRMLLPRPSASKARKRTIRAPSWCAACRSTSASRRPPRTSTACRAWSATRCRRRRS